LRRSNGFEATVGTQDRPRFQLMSARVDSALAAAYGVSANLKPESNSLLIPATEMSYSLFLYNRGEKDVKITGRTFRIDGREAGSNTSSSLLKSGSTFRSEETYAVPYKTLINMPQSEHLYDGHLFGEELSEEFRIEVEGAAFNVLASRQFNVAPLVEIENISPSPLVVTPQTFEAVQSFTFRLNSHLTG